MSEDSISETAINMLLNGNIKKHTMGDNSSEYNEVQMKRETRIFKEFLPTKNAHMILNSGKEFDYE